MSDVLETFSLTREDEAGFRSLDLVRLSDIFRRAGKDAFDEPDLADVFHASAVQLAEGLHAYENRAGIDRTIGDMVRKIVLVAKAHDVDGIVLPVEEGTLSGQYLRQQVLMGESFARHHGIHIGFQAESYDSAPEVEKLGAPVEGRKSVFDFGLF